MAIGPAWLQPDTIISWLGPWALVGVAAIIFAECGLLIGFFLPGDSLLFTAGLFAVSAAGLAVCRCGWCAWCWSSPRWRATSAATGSDG